MNDPTFLAQMIALSSLAVGFWAGWACTKARQDARAEKALAEAAHWKEEGMRLRAQVARLVGTEPTIVARSDRERLAA